MRDHRSPIVHSLMRCIREKCQGGTAADQPPAPPGPKLTKYKRRVDNLMVKKGVGSTQRVSATKSELEEPMGNGQCAAGAACSTVSSSDAAAENVVHKEASIASNERRKAEKQKFRVLRTSVTTTQDVINQDNWRAIANKLHISVNRQSPQANFSAAQTDNLRQRMAEDGFFHIGATSAQWPVDIGALVSQVEGLLLKPEHASVAGGYNTCITSVGLEPCNAPSF